MAREKQRAQGGPTPSRKSSINWKYDEAVSLNFQVWWDAWSNAIIMNVTINWKIYTELPITKN